MSRYISPLLYVLLIVVGCIAFISIAGVRVGVFQPLTGFYLLKWSVFSSSVLAALALVSMLLCYKKCSKGCNRFFILVFVSSAIYSGFWLSYYLEKISYPKINDITTDTMLPPAYLNISSVRKSSDNSLSYNEEWASIQEENYPEIQPVISHHDVQTVFAQVVSLVEERGWELVSRYDSVGVLEATAQTPVFAFRDDVIIRVIKIKSETRVDMRSSSRVGWGGDFGMNAERIENFMSDLAERLVAIP
ncbi:DUF1499 domain-containing protein [Marinomonas epiphytica]